MRGFLKGGIFIKRGTNSIQFYWNIGKLVYEKESSCSNAIQKYSDYFSYLFGNSFLFTRENIHLMKRFYMNYPIYDNHLELLSWDQYELFLKIKNKEERQFYYYISLLFHSDYEESLTFICNNYFVRI